MWHPVPLDHKGSGPRVVRIAQDDIGADQIEFRPEAQTREELVVCERVDPENTLFQSLPIVDAARVCAIVHGVDIGQPESYSPLLIQVVGRPRIQHDVGEITERRTKSATPSNFVPGKSSI